MSKTAGVFTVSLDFERYWGVRDKRAIKEYQANLMGVDNAIEKILEQFDKYDIHATWAAVGFLFAHDIDELRVLSPEQKPGYTNTLRDPYRYIEDNSVLEPFCHFSPEMIDKIKNAKNQEVGTHTFSHFYCLEDGQIANEFRSDIEAAINIAKKSGITIKSLVFPRNQWNNDYFSILDDCGIISYRGNEKGWIYKAVNPSEERLARRALRLIDSYINISGSNGYPLDSIDTVPPVNIPSSRFLRPVSKRFSKLEHLRKRRIIKSLEQCAIKGEVFHLWWHPHNFGVNTEDNIEFLEVILSRYKEMKIKHGMRSLNMGELGELVLKGVDK
jgi:peptidoglycan/xylan/chitin deacetylase (PgdA/CDA1 family)